MSYDGNEEYWFRFVSLTESQVSELKQNYIKIDVRPKRDLPGRFVASLKLSADTQYHWLASFVRSCNAPDSEYGIFVSLVTEYDSEIITMPEFVRAIYNETGGQIEFSFTVVKI